ncbi:hypothetical protein RBB75_06305 [Tunturibacter empetritectus]|uniref:Uncharacterized protein n=1 Tax=Tunturiibacter empetritectus TaxID=3069691 RepID=A0AAU7ZGL3_9BACT
MANSREKKRLGWIDGLFIVLTGGVWIVTVYKVVTNGIPSGLLPGEGHPGGAGIVLSCNDCSTIFVKEMSWSSGSWTGFRDH